MIAFYTDGNVVLYAGKYIISLEMADCLKRQYKLLGFTQYGKDTDKLIYFIKHD